MKFLKVKTSRGEWVLINLHNVSEIQQASETESFVYTRAEDVTRVKAPLDQVQQAIEWLNDEPRAVGVIDNP